MGIFDIFKVKEPTTIEGSIHIVTNKKGEKFLHIKEFSKFLTDYKSEVSDDAQIAILDQLINELNNA